ncbi:MAG: hypothetical protein CM1200mP28_09730 [Deltaproteobacteria bacterium]|nr:MAG: hypothetical protein CM1200mP28_09730 [Deltaproteobacteria bacterium]
MEDSFFAYYLLGRFCLWAGLSSTFFLIPMILVNHGYERAEMWKIYLPMMLAGALMMILAAVFAEVVTAFVKLCCLEWFCFCCRVAMGIGHEKQILLWFVAALFLFFMGFKFLNQFSLLSLLGQLQRRPRGLQWVYTTSPSFLDILPVQLLPARFI